MQEQTSSTGPFALKLGPSAGPDKLLSATESRECASGCQNRPFASQLTTRHQLFVLFFISGFCGLVYQMVWMRLAFASFGIITPVLSVVISVFMLGLSVGAWAGGRIIPGLVRRTGVSAIHFYAVAEFIIGLVAFAVPKLFGFGGHILLASGQTNSFQYLFLSAAVLAAAVLPWCVCMGATFPFMMAFVRERDQSNKESFSYLYLANVLGAMFGTIVTAFVLIEVLGFRDTLAFAAAGNFIIAVWSVNLGRRNPAPSLATTADDAPSAAATASASGNRLLLWMLFSTGFSAMALEMVWTRAFTPVLRTQVYSFALIVVTYLGATFAGSWFYRRDLQNKSQRSLAWILVVLALAAFLPILAVDPRVLPTHLNWFFGMYQERRSAVLVVLAGICPLCGVLGYLTPSLIDQYAGGHPAAAGKAYSINVVGCILGPLFASYVLLPHLSERMAMILLGLPLLALCLAYSQTLTQRQRTTSMLVGAGTLAWCLFGAQDFQGMLEKSYKGTQVRRDYAASVLSFGQDFRRHLLVNGVGMTTLCPETKFMVHLPMALHKDPPESALIICFGMGTSFRAALSWGVQTTAVELVPSVRDAFGFYYDDAALSLSNPKGRVVIDDGRRFLNRTREQYDVMVIDPPPPVEAAGSSLLYSKDFYEVVKQHLKPGGILQIWFPTGLPATLQAVERSLHESFPCVRCFQGVSGWGTHFLASMQPIEPATSQEMAARMPVNAQKDLLEWNPKQSASGYLNQVVSKGTNITELLDSSHDYRITDDRPFNEYFLLREGHLYAP
ncbi:MAG TPA: fused MFS/spermidine synthase [Verrucomicrobiae bacterium]|jgi:predicted membrane-bound spermidine synthase|nr:fused MFS/spermidine synthase [Verrucomicrobiae bacterium]